MKEILLSCCFFFTAFFTNAQAPSVVKVVESTVTEPSATTQTEWVNNQWNGLFFYQGVGSPTKLCVTDGTNAGTQYLADIGSGNVSAILPAQDFVYIITRRIVSFPPLVIEDQLWKSDGTAAGTSLVYTFAQAGSAGNISWWSDKDSKRNYSVHNNNMYFTAWDAATGYELWKTDGTTAGTAMVIDLKAGTGNSNPMAFCKLGNEIFFTATAVGLERKLWKTDGTAGGTVQIPVAEPFFILDFAVGIVNNKMIFYAHNTVDGYEPYVSDGTAAGTFMLKDISAGAGNSWIAQSQNAHLKFNNRHCYFIANNGTANALWRTDGTAAGTIQLTTNAQNAYSNVSGGSYTDTDSTGLWMIEYNTSGSGNNEKLYRSNGTVAGTYLVAQNLAYAQNVKLYKGALWMASRNTGSNANTEPWRSGGNAATTNKAFEVAPGLAPVVNIPYSSEPFGFFEKNNKLYFFAKDQASITKLFQYTGDFTFNGSVAGGLWKDSANWNGLLPPGITDSVYVNAGTPNALNVTGGNAYAGTLLLGNTAAVNIAAATDSIIVNTRIAAGGNNSFTGDGILAVRNIEGDTVQVNNGFTAANFAVLAKANLAANNITVGNNLHLANNSQLVINNNTVTLSGTASTITQTGNSYITTNGTGKLIIENIGAAGRTGAVIFPVGSAGNYNPVVITNTGTADNFGVRVQPQVFASYTGEAGTGAYTNNAVDATWFITEAAAGGSNADIILQWNAAQELPGFNRSSSQFGHYNGSWQLSSAAAATGTDPYTFSGTGISSFSPFGITNNNAVLPLRFISFSAQKCGSSSVCLNWKTANELNVSHFKIERSIDGYIFTAVSEKQAGNLASGNYAAADDISSLGNKTTVYYRLKQVDANGSFTYSNTVRINLMQQLFISMYPNPAADKIYISGYENALWVQLYDAGGNLVTAMPASPDMDISRLAKGMYVLKVLLKSGATQQLKFIKQ